MTSTSSPITATALNGPATESRRSQFVAGILLVVVLIVIAVIVFTPGPPDASGQRGLVAWFYRAHQQGLPMWIDFSLIEAASNVVMFAPIGFLAAIALRRHTWLVVVAAAAFSSLIEIGQWFFLPERTASTRDVLANTAGALLGWLIALPWTRRQRRVRVSRERGTRLAG